jgi:Domain of unknown function (DUF4351)
MSASFRSLNGYWLPNSITSKEPHPSLILRQLVRRVGILPDRLCDRIEQLPIAQLESLAEALLDFKQLDDLVQWLAIDR